MAEPEEIINIQRIQVQDSEGKYRDLFNVDGSRGSGKNSKSSKTKSTLTSKLKSFKETR